MPTSHTRRLFQAASKLLETLDNLEELLILFETSEPTYEARLWIDADTLKPLVNALENKTKLRTLTLQNARGTNRLLFCQPVRLAGGLELFKAVPRLKNLALAGVSPTTDHFNMDWKMQASLKSLMPSLERVDFNFPLVSTAFRLSFGY